MAPRRSVRKQVDTPKSSTPSPTKTTSQTHDKTTKKSNKKSSSTPKPTTTNPVRDPLKSPISKKTKASGTLPYLSPVPFAASTQMSGKEASDRSSLVRFDLHICASGQEFCRAPWTKPIGHRCVVCKNPVHSFCYGQHGETLPAMCALCVSPVGVMAGVIAPVGKPDGFDEFYKSFLADEIDDIGVLQSTTAANIYTPSGLQASAAPFNPTNNNESSSTAAPPIDVPETGNDEVSASDPLDSSDDEEDLKRSSALGNEGDTATVESNENSAKADTSSKDNAETTSNQVSNGTGDTEDQLIPTRSIEQKSFDFLAGSSKSVFSGNSDNTAVCANTDRVTVRIFVCQMVPKFDKDANFHTVFASGFNRFMTGIISIEPQVRIIKWTATSATIDTDSLTAITRVKSEYKQYIYCSFRGESAGKKYLRIQLSIPADSDIVNILLRLQEEGTWWEGWNCFARQVGSNATQPITIGWFLRSSAVHIGSRDLQNTLRVLVKDPLLGLECQRISQKPKAVVMNYRKRAIQMKNPQQISVSAIHVEVQEGSHRSTLNKLEKIYSGKDCPLGINFHFVRQIDMPKMQTRSGRGGHAKCVTHQYAFELMIDHARTEIHNIDGIVQLADGDISLRQALMNLRVKTIKNCIGDKLFLSINRESPGSNTFLFEFHLLVEAEATELVEYLPVFLRDVFIVRPKDYMDYGVCKNVEYMKWDESKRCGVDPEMEKFEQFVEELPDVIREDGDDGGFDGLDPLGQAMYKRAAGDCDETVMSDTSRHKSALDKVTNINGKKKKHAGIEIDLDGESIRSALSSSTNTSKVDAAKQEITAEFTLIIDTMKEARSKEKEETDKVLDLMRSELENNRLMMQQQSALLATLAAAAGATNPLLISPAGASVSNNLPTTASTTNADPNPDITTTNTATTTTTNSPDTNNNDQDEPGSGSDGAESQ